MQTTTEPSVKKLPILNNKVELDVEAELKKYEQEQMAMLGLEAGKRHWRDEEIRRRLRLRSARTPPFSSPA